MLLLALDSPEARCSAALWDGARPEHDALLGYRHLAAGGSQADRLIDLIDGLLRDLGCDYRDLAAIAVNHGPGSFTGIRSAVAAARGLGLAAGLPVLAIGGLEALATAVAPAPGTLLAALDARRGQVYVQAFAGAAEPLTPPRLTTPAEAAAGLAGPLRLAGSGAPLIRAALPADHPAALEAARLDARAIARCAARRLAAGARPGPGFALRPLYLRPPDARPQRPMFATAAAGS